MRKLYCSGTFPFDYQRPDYQEQAAGDYRSLLLGSLALLLQPGSVQVNSGVEYIGPFYFESDGMVDRDIVRSEMDMVSRCTDAVFLLDGAACPGTVCELTMAGMLGKAVHLFYLTRSENEETESTLHTPCWYPIIHSSLINAHTRLYPCADFRDAVGQIRALVDSWKT